MTRIALLVLLTTALPGAMAAAQSGSGATGSQAPAPASASSCPLTDPAEARLCGELDQTNKKEADAYVKDLDAAKAAADQNGQDEQAAREVVTKQYQARLEKAQQMAQSLQTGHNVPTNTPSMGQAQQCASKTYDNTGQCVPLAEIVNKQTASKQEDATAKAPADEGSAAAGATGRPAIPPYVSDDNSSANKPFKLSDSAKQASIFGLWGLLLGCCLGGLGLGIVLACGAAGFSEADSRYLNPSADGDSGGKKEKPGGSGTSGSSGGGSGGGSSAKPNTSGMGSVMGGNLG